MSTIKPAVLQWGPCKPLYLGYPASGPSRPCQPNPTMHSIQRISGPAALAPSSLHEVWIVSEFCNLGPLLTAIERGAFLTQSFAAQGQPNLVSILQVGDGRALTRFLHVTCLLAGYLPCDAPAANHSGRPPPETPSCTGRRCKKSRRHWRTCTPTTSFMAT